MPDLQKPMFSIILAFYNEAKYLEACLKSLDEQTLSREMWEIILVDGCSTDGSEEIANQYVMRYANAILINNPLKVATAGWNAGLKVVKGKYYQLVSGHSIIDKYFYEKAYAILKTNENIHALGGRVYKIGNNILSNSISETTNLPFAMGGAYYRIGTKAKKTNIIGLGIYLKELNDKLGPYDEDIKRSGDWEFNYRVVSNGYNMYFDPSLVIKVFTRANFKSLFIQQFRTGFWKIRVWTKHKKAILPRHFIPAVFILWLLLSPITILYLDLSSLLFTIPAILYFIAASISTIKASHENTRWYYIMLTFPVLHISYGLGFISGIFRWGNLFFKQKQTGKQ